MIKHSAQYYGGPQVQTQQHILETQQTIFGTQHNIIETQHNFIETQHKIFSKFMQNLCYYTTYKRIITQPLTFYAPALQNPAIFGGHFAFAKCFVPTVELG